MTTEFFAGVDAAWLHMDRPTNLAQIAGVMIFDTPIDRARLIKVIQQRLLVYDRFRQRVREPLLGWGPPRWERDPHLDLNYHLPQVELPAPGGQAELQKFVGGLMSVPLDRRHPLWQIYSVPNYNGGCVLVPCLHHCLADGLALVQVLLSLTDLQPDAPPRPPRAKLDRAGTHQSGFDPFRPLTQLIDTTTSVARTVTRETLFNLVEPARITRSISVGGLGITAAGKLLLTSPDQPTILYGKCGVEKRAAWSTAFSVSDIVRLGRAWHGTLNDVMLTAATGALRRYLERRGQLASGNVRAMIPVSIRALHDFDKLGNQFGLAILSLPVGVRDPLTRLRVLKQRMDDIKDTSEAWVVFGALSVMGLTPARAEKAFVDIFAAKVSAVMTNVPGPRQPLYLAGQRLRSFMFWVPRSGDIGLGLSILSYADEVYVGIATDAGLIPDPQAIVDEFHVELTDMLRLVPPTRSALTPIEKPSANDSVTR